MNMVDKYINEIQDDLYDPKKRWYGVDLDRTLAEHNGWKGVNHIGKPVPKMMERVKKWIDEGINVKIFTARASHPKGIPPVKKWLKENGLPDLEITCIKDMHLVRIYDDRAVQVRSNTGELLGNPEEIAE